MILFLHVGFIPFSRAPALPCARQMLRAGVLGTLGVGTAQVLPEWSLHLSGIWGPKVIKDTDCEVDNLMATCVTEKINNIVREWMGSG